MQLEEWVRSLPEGAVVRWTEDGMSAARPFASGYADVVFADACDELGLNWALTVHLPGARQGGEDAYHLPVEPDIDVWEFRGPGERWNAFSVPRGTRLPARATAELETAENRESRIRRGPGWSAERISSALAAWGASACRRRDVRFVFDSEIETPIDRQLREQIDLGDPAEDIPEHEARGLFERVFGEWR